jgi:Tol biopolymer transport system component
MDLKIFFIILSLAFTITDAQDLKVTRTRKITPDKTGEFSVSGVSPDGRYLLITRPGSRGLYLMEPENGQTRMVTQSPGAGYDPFFSDDSRFLYVQSDDYANKRRQTSTTRIDIQTGDTTKIEKQDDVAIAQLPENQNNIRVKLEELTPVLFRNGEKKSLKPGGEGSYIWVSLSPDKTRILYYLVGEGTGICDLDGNKQASTKNLHAPKWLNNEIIVGMDDRDDGHRILSSEIVAWAYSDNRKIMLTSTSNRNEMNPHPFPDGKKIAFSTTEGELFLMSIEVK